VNEGTKLAVRGYVLAGGGSTRFGQDKALARIDGAPMIVRLCRLFDGWTDGAAIVGSAGKYGGFATACFADRWPGEGPLGGIITALLETALSGDGVAWNLIVGCDMPFLSEDFLRYIADRALRSGCDVVTPKSAHGLEPLCACWRTDAAGKLRAVFGSGVRKVTEAMKQLDVEVLDESQWKRFDSAGRLFWNMNTQADYEQALAAVQAASEGK
jgi:molybdopterin-guanine dinucleotide biosynthesis protein A